MSSTCIVYSCVVIALVLGIEHLNAEHSLLDNNNDNRSIYPIGDPRRCYNAKQKEIIGFEVLPGGGWDNLRNRDSGMIMAMNYSQCRTTDDGRYLVPDGVYTIPVKSSKVESYAELFEHWNSYTSTLSSSVNVHAGLSLTDFSVSGSFSSEYQHIKERQYFDKTVTTRIQARYVRYVAKLEPDTAVNDAFRNRLRKIAAHITLNRTDLARYESQLLVRDFGTHVITSLDVGAALVQEDQLNSELLRSKDFDRTSIMAAASASFFGLFDFGAGYSRTTSQTTIDQYMKNRTSSSILTYGGPIYKPQNFSANMWTDEISTDMVALDRSGDPIYYAVSDVTLPDVPLYTVYDVYDHVKAAVDIYYLHNVYRGCTKRDSPNFSFQANVDDGTCKPPNTNYTFGGVYQTCSGSGYTDLCVGMTQKNPLTGQSSCPDGYESIILQKGSKSSSTVKRECHSCWLFFHCCNNNRYTASAQFTAYWCAAKGPVPANHGFLFGGLYTPILRNPMTESSSCPLEFYPLHLLGNLVVCVSDDYELGYQYSLPFAGFFSCISGNPLALRDNLSTGKSKMDGSPSLLKSYMLESGSSSYPRECPKGYSQHLAVVDNGCEIEYCVKFGSLSSQGLPKVQRPPFMAAPKDGYTKLTDATTVMNDDGTVWTNMNNAEGVVSDYLKKNDLPNPDSTMSTPSKHKSSDNDGNGSKLSGGGIAAISILATLVCVFGATIIVISVRRRKSRLYRETNLWQQPNERRNIGVNSPTSYGHMDRTPISSREWLNITRPHF